MSTNTIIVDNLMKRYGDVTAVNNLSFSVKKGELFGLLGPNGSGKTTMIKILTGQIKPTFGRASVLDVDVLSDPLHIRELVGIVPEQETPPSFLTAEEYLIFISHIRKIRNYENQIDTWFHRLDFLDQKNTLCKDLSRGTRQKLMVAQAFLHEPLVAFIDEPLINLDPIIQRVFKDFLLEYISKGNTVFFSTHVLEIAEEICSEIAILDKGSLLFKGSMDSIKGKQINLESFFIKLVKEKVML